MNRALAVPAAIALLVVAGCKNDFSPQSDLLGLRVLALRARPLELAPGESVTVQATSYVPAGATVLSERWTFCPLSAGAVAAYACAVPQCEVELTPAPDGTVTANPTEIIAACLGFPVGTIPPGVPDQILTVFRYRIATDLPASRDAVLQIPQWTRRPPPDPNLPPVIDQVLIGGRVVWENGAPVGVPPLLPPNGLLPVELRIDPASVQTYTDAAGVLQTETMTGYFYTTAGTFSAGITTGVDTINDLEGTNLVAGQIAKVWIVALDLRGGQAVAGPIDVTVGP